MVKTHLNAGKGKGKERLILAAQTLAKEIPFDEMTIDEIVREANLSRPAFYYHFNGGKEELREELVRRGSLSDVPAQDTRQSMLEAALRVFARSGVSAATLDEIAAEAGVSRGALCWHFHSKDDLLTAIIEKKGALYAPLREALEAVERDLDSSIPLDDETIIRRLAAGFYDSFTAQSDIVRLPVLLLHTHPHMAHLLADRIVKGRKGITEYVKRRQDEGGFRKDIDASFFVQVLASAFMMRAIGQGLNDLLPFAHMSREEAINEVASLLLHGMTQCPHCHP